jgi:hypothetical protein
LVFCIANFAELVVDSSAKNNEHMHVWTRSGSLEALRACWYEKNVEKRRQHEPCFCELM